MCYGLHATNTSAVGQTPKIKHQLNIKTSLKHRETQHSTTKHVSVTMFRTVEQYVKSAVGCSPRVGRAIGHWPRATPSLTHRWSLGTHTAHSTSTIPQVKLSPPVTPRVKAARHMCLGVGRPVSRLAETQSHEHNAIDRAKLSRGCHRPVTRLTRSSEDGWYLNHQRKIDVNDCSETRFAVA